MMISKRCLFLLLLFFLPFYFEASNTVSVEAANVQGKNKADAIVPIATWLCVADLTLTEGTLPPDWCFLADTIYSPWNAVLHKTLEILAKNFDITIHEKKVQAIQPGKGAPFNIHFYHLKGKDFSQVESFFAGFLKPRKWAYFRMGDIYLIVATKSDSVKDHACLALQERYFLALASVLADPEGRPEVGSTLGLEDKAAGEAFRLAKKFLDTGQPGKAIHYYEKTLDLRGRNISPLGKWRILLGLGQAQRIKGDESTSKETLTKALQLAATLSPDTLHSSRIHLSATLARMGNSEEALALLHQAFSPAESRPAKEGSLLLKKVCATEKALEELVKEDADLAKFLK